MQKQQPGSLGQRRTDLNANRIGDLAEQYVCSIAGWKGAEVFKNTNCTGKADLILNIDGQLVQIDVKVAQWNKRDSCWNSVEASKVKLPVYPVLVIPEGDIANWKIRWKNATKSKNSRPHCPPGLENFWKKSTNEKQITNGAEDPDPIQIKENTAGYGQK